MSEYRNDCFQFAYALLYRKGCNKYGLITKLSDEIEQIVVDFLDALDADDDTVEGRLHDAERARACNGER